MKQLLSFPTIVFSSILTFAAPVASHAETFLFDFGNTATSGLATDGNYWNNISSTFGSLAGNKLEGLLTSENVPTLLTLEIVTRFNGENTNGTQSSTLDFPVSSTRDSLYGNTAEFNGQSNIFPSFKITGLDLTQTYDFTFFASRTGVSDNRETLYTVTGTDTSAVALNAANNVDQTVTVAGIVPNASGEILIALTPGPNNNNVNNGADTKFTYLNVLEMNAVPEPSTAACLLGGMAVLVARRRRAA